MFKTTVGQVTVLGGHQYDGATNTLVDERVSRGRKGGNLYVFVETPQRGRADDPDSAAGRLAEVVHQTYVGRRGSVTAGLQQAVREANRLLFDENRNSLPTERLTAGISCVVLRDDDLFIAQAGPAAAYVMHDDQVTRFPDVSPWLDDVPLEEVDTAPLGDRSDAHVALFHLQVSPGDVVLLIESDLARAMPPQAWDPILAEGRLGGSQAVLDRLLEAARGCDLTALAVTIGDGGAGVEPGPAAPESAGFRRESSVMAGLSQWAGQLQLGDRLRGAAKAVAAALAGLWVGLRTLARRMVPSGAPVGGATRRGRQAGPPAARWGEAEKAPRGRSRTGARAPTQGEIVHKALIGAAVAIPLVVAVVVAITLLQRGQTRRAELDALWQQATSNWQQANTATDLTSQRTYLAAAQSSLDRFLERQPERADAVSLRQDVIERLDQVNQVKRIGWVGELHSYSGDVVLSRVVVQGMHVFVMDRRSGQVHHHQLDITQQSLQPDSKVVVKKGDQVDGTLVNDLVDMVWMGIDQGNIRQRPALVILESGGALIEYDPTTGERRALQVTARDADNYAQLVGSHTGRLYVLDPNTNKIWRYDATPDGYGGAPTDWLQASADLAGVVDMAIGDGIYLLYADGRISKLILGQPADFSTADWDAPPRDPRALSSYPPDETEWIYVADSGNSRIVQSANDGKFTRQFKLSDAQLAEKGDILKKAASLFVDESVKRAYFLSGNKLYVISLSE
ncbi:MAG: hypothetical protein JXM73_02700 [Anaerolineae bacterium]|nr:hypothetical protein [Anaerolineae bacterium]